MNTTPTTTLPYRYQRWKGLIQRDWAAQFPVNQDPLAWMTSLTYERTRYRLSRQIYRVHTHDGTVYLKVILGLNERSMQPNRPLMDRLKWQFRPSRALTTFRVSQAMLAHDIWCPAPLLAAREYRGSESRDIFVAEAIDLPGLGVRLAQATDDVSRIAMVRSVAPHIAKLHAERFLHGDLLPNNLHVTDDLQRVYFMDNDRTRRWPCALPWLVLRRNLAQLCFRLLRHQGQDVTRAFLQAYALAAHWSKLQADRRSNEVLKAAACRLKHFVPQNPQPPLPPSDLPPGQAPEQTVDQSP